VAQDEALALPPFVHIWRRKAGAGAIAEECEQGVRAEGFADFNQLVAGAEHGVFQRDAHGVIGGDKAEPRAHGGWPCIEEFLESGEVRVDALGDGLGAAGDAFQEKLIQRKLL
jgi:hypothetical protein